MFAASRPRAGEAIAGLAAVALAALMFLAPWYGVIAGGRRIAPGLAGPGSVDGFHGLPTIRWLILVTIVAALGLTWLQATRPAPALPVSFSVIATVLGLLTTLALIYRVLINVPGPDSYLESRLGAYLGLIAAAVLTGGAFRSLREETPPDVAQVPVATVSLPRRS